MSINFVSPSGKPITIQVPEASVASRVASILSAGGTVVQVAAQTC